MASRDVFVRHFFGGGWATDFGPTAQVDVSQQQTVTIPWLNEADNVVYELDGGPRKAPGASKLNSVQMQSGADVKGIYDAWFSGTGGTPTQRRICHVGTTIKKDDADGTFTNIFTGLESGKVPSYTMLEDLLIMTSDSTADVPKSWDGSTAQNLAGSPPNFSFCTTHKNRVWASGNAANPSRLYYTVLLTPADWAGSGSGSIDIDPDDGDIITGIISHRNELIVFKGPNKGSIHRVAGSAPTGDDAFSRVPLVKGIGAVWHNTIIPVANDVIFMWSDGTIHSLQATNDFGDYNLSSLSRPINSWIRDHVNKARLRHAWAADWPEKSFALFTVPIDSSQTNNIILMMDYSQGNAVKWAYWSSFNDTQCLAQGVDASDNNARVVFAGGGDGYIRKLGRPTRSIDDATTISYRVLTPFMSYGSPHNMKNIHGGYLSIQPRNSGNITFGWQRDANAQQTDTVAQGGTAVLGSFVLDSDTLGGSRYVDRFFRLETGGEFRSVQFQLSNNVLAEDVEIHGFGADLKSGAGSYEN